MIRHYLKAIICILLAALQTGCTIVGLGIGMMDDNASRNPKWKNIAAIETGEQVEVTKTNGKVYAGAYTGTTQMEEQEYDRLLRQCRENLPENIKYLGGLQPVDIILYQQSYRNGIIVGYAPDSLFIKIPTNPFAVPVQIKPGIRIKSDDSRSVSGNMLQKLLEEHTVPTRSVVHLQTGIGDLPIAMNDIQSVRLTGSRNNGKLIGGGLGLLFDAIIFGSIARSFP